MISQGTRASDSRGGGVGWTCASSRGRTSRDRLGGRMPLSGVACAVMMENPNNGPSQPFLHALALSRGSPAGSLPVFQGLLAPAARASVLCDDTPGLPRWPQRVTGSTASSALTPSPQPRTCTPAGGQPPPPRAPAMSPGNRTQGWNQGCGGSLRGAPGRKERREKPRWGGGLPSADGTPSPTGLSRELSPRPPTKPAHPQWEPGSKDSPRREPSMGQTRPGRPCRVLSSCCPVVVEG